MSNEQILLAIAGLLLLIITVYKLPIHRCPKCKNEGHEVVHTFSDRKGIITAEMRFYECKKCEFSWGHRTIDIKKKNSPQ